MYNNKIDKYLSNGLRSSMNLPYDAQPRVIGTMKAIQSKVGGGLLATQFGRDPSLIAFEEEFARENGEIGVTTGRLRQLGWVDLPALRYVQSINPLDIVVITKGDMIRILATAQKQAGIPQEMRFYKSFTNPDTGIKTTSGVTTDPMMVGNYTSIPLSTKSTKKIYAVLVKKSEKVLNLMVHFTLEQGQGKKR